MVLLLIKKWHKSLSVEIAEKNCLGESKSVGRPGPERNLSPDDVTQLLKERDQLAEEVNSLETSYSELFRRYEKLRQTSVEIKRVRFLFCLFITHGLLLAVLIIPSMG